MNVNETCKVLCGPRALSGEQRQAFVDAVDELYTVHFILDNLPAAVTGLTTDDSVLYGFGWPVGERMADTNEAFLHNHMRFTVKYHEAEDGSGAKRIVGFEVHPMSIDFGLHPSQAGGTEVALPNCVPGQGMSPAEAHKPLYIDGDRATQTTTVTFSYDVFWEHSDVQWASRWDVYLQMGDATPDSVYWFQILTAAIMVVLLSFMLAMILARALRIDISAYNRVATDEEAAEAMREDSGWKLVHGDVFRPPTRYPMIFAVLIGAATQVASMSVATVVFAALGFLSPAARGSMLSGLLVFWVLSGLLAGYASARTHKVHDGKMWQRTTLLTALTFPSLVFGVLFVLNLVVWAEGSSNAVPFGTMVAVAALWLGIAVPLTFAGAWAGYKREKVELPVRTKTIPRQIPTQRWYMRTSFLCAAGGLLPLLVLASMLIPIYHSLWNARFFYLFGFVLLTGVLAMIAAAEITIAVVYFTVTFEDWRWWWRSFMVPGATGFWVFLFAVYYHSQALTLDGFAPVLLYYGYNVILSCVIGFTMAAAGHHTSFFFMRKIYAAIPVD